MATRSYAVGAAFSVRGVTDDYRWRPTDYFWSDVYYGPARPIPASNNRRAAPVSRKIDPSRIRTPEQMRAVARSLA